MIPLEPAEMIVLEYIRTHEKPDGVDVDTMTKDLESEGLVGPGDSLGAVHGLYRKAYIERRYDGRVEIPEW